MITAIYSISHVHGAELWLLFWAICFIAYFGVCMIIKQNRTKHGVKNVLIGMLAAEVVIDLIWAIIYYHNGTYLNYGIGAVYGLLLLIPVLVITLIIVTSRNKKTETQSHAFILERTGLKKITFEKQMIIGLAFLLLMHICSWIFSKGVFVNIGWVVYGLLFIINPVCPEKSRSVKNIRLWVRLAGVLCIIVGIMTRYGV